MREIKFRAWLDFWPKPAYPFLASVITLSMGVIDGRKRYHIKFQCFEGQYETNIEPERLMQYTGLHDKNGEEIWEGDVISTLYGNITFKIPETYFLLAKRPDDFIKEIEVIGNIWENSGSEVVQIKKPAE